MPSVLSYPGIYIEEIPSGVRTITGVATSITAFIGRAPRGEVDRAVRVQSFAEYSRLFGGLSRSSPMSYAVSQFFQHGGRDALIVRVFNGDADTDTATLTLGTTPGNLVLEAASPGTWGSRLRARVDHLTRDTSDTLLFNLTVEALDRAGGTTVVASEPFRNVSVSPGSARFVDTVLKAQSALVRVRTSAPADESPVDGTANATTTATDGGAIIDTQIAGDRDARTGLYALEAADLFNLLCIPPPSFDTDLVAATWATAAAYCRERRAVLIIDAPSAWPAHASPPIATAATGVNGLRAPIGFNRRGCLRRPSATDPDRVTGRRCPWFRP